MSNDLEGAIAMRFQKKALVICFILVFFLISTGLLNVLTVSQQNVSQRIDSGQKRFDCTKSKESTGYDKETYIVPTPDDSSITLTRYKGSKSPIIFIHGMGCNHLIYDWDEGHSLARYLNERDWDVWLLDLRTHDCDGDFRFAIGSDREYIDRYWDFDNTLLKIDVVTAVDFVKNKTGIDRLFLSGHSYGGYLAYAYAMLIGEESLSGIITTGASPYYTPDTFHPEPFEMIRYGFYIGNKAFVNPIGKPYTHFSKISCIINKVLWKPTANPIFYYDTSSEYIQRNIGFTADDEAAGVYVDIFFGKDPNKYSGHWVDPQTLYDYSENLDEITVPILFIAGEEDTQDPSDDIYRAYQCVSSTEKTFYSFPKHSHLDLLLGDDADELIFPKITQWLENRENEMTENKN